MFDANENLEREYGGLTDKQKAVIDSHAEHPNATNRDKARFAAEKLPEGESVNESYCSQIINRDYPKVAQYRAEIVQNQRSQGSITTEGDPFEGQLEQDKSYQTIQERPVKDTQDDEPVEPTPTTPVARQYIQVQTVDDGVLVKFDYAYLRELLQNQQANLPPELHEKLVDSVFQAFTTEGSQSA